MNIELLRPFEYPKMLRAGQAAAATLAWVGAQLKPGMSTKDIDALVREDTERRGASPSQLGYNGFPAAVCTSRNQVVCHGIPSRKELLKEGDIINVDVTSCLDGYHGDTSQTFLIGECSGEAIHVRKVAKTALEKAIEIVRPGVRLGDIGATIENYVKSEGCSVVRDYGGHGIGRQMHLPPHVNHHGKAGRGLRLKPGMAITIEPMVNLGTEEVILLEDEWTVVTRDGQLSAQFEHTLLITEEGCDVTTYQS